jgi:hypothetical protein
MLLLLGVIPSPAEAGCAVCASGDPLASMGQARLTPGGTQLALEVEQASSGGRSDEDPAFLMRLNQSTVRALMAFSPWESTTLLIQLPVLRKAMSHQTAGYPAVSHAPSGLGDVELGARFFLFDRTGVGRRSRDGLALTVGSSVPTGSNTLQADGYRLAEHSQLGTGALGPYAGLLYAFSRDPWTVSAAVTGRLRLRNAYEYQYGSAVLWSVRGDYQPLEYLVFSLGLDGRYAGRDLHGTTPYIHTGGLVFAAAPGVRVRLPGKLWLQASAQLPVFTSLYGEQRVGPTFSGGVQYLIE